MLLTENRTLKWLSLGDNLMSDIVVPAFRNVVKKNKKLGKGGMDLHNMDAATVAQMMHKMNPQMLAHLGGQQGLEQMMQEMEKEEKKLNPNKRR